MSKAFWPGFSWRVLAHKREGKRASMSSESFDARCGCGEPNGYPGYRIALDGDWEFDELVIDDWFHLEQMSARNWWMGVGNGDDYWHVNIRIDGKGKAAVLVEKQ